MRKRVVRVTLSSPICICTDGSRPVSYCDFNTVSLKGGDYVSFSIVKCSVCEKHVGIPVPNFRRAIIEGTEETLRHLRRIGILVDEAKRLYEESRA